MTNEIKLTLRATVVNGDYRANFQPTGLQFDQATQGAQAGIITVNTSVDVVLGSTQLVTEGWLAMLNLDSTNYVTYGAVASTTVALANPIGRIEAGEPAIFRAEPNAVIKLRANGGAVNLQYLWLED